MKKILALTLALIMLLSVVSCTRTNNGNTTTTTTTTTNNNNNNETPDGDGNEDDAADDLSSALAETFAATLQANPEATAEELINAICADTRVPYTLLPAPIEVETEYFFGFEEHLITGFESGALCMPMIGSIPFITYVFELPADADAEAFTEQLKSNFNRRWLQCVESGDPVIKVVDNMVFFSACPAPDAE